MNKKLILTLGLTLLGVIVVNGELSLSSNDIKKGTDKGYILSDNYNTYNDCSDTKDRYNQEFTNYKRSECFSNEEGYKYFICQPNDTCTVESSSDTINSNNTSNTTGVKISNQDKLDKFLLKIEGMKIELNNNDKYAQLLNSVIVKLTTLGTKYQNNTTISEMVTYLKKGVIAIQEDFEKNKDVDSFFCELSGGCDNTSPMPTQNSAKMYMSNTGPNDLSKLNGTVYLDKQLYVILDGVNKSNPPKGCAKLAGTAGCDNPRAGFRDYLANEWVSNTRIVSEGAGGIAANTFPAGDYEFYSLYGNTITKVGYGKLIASPSSGPKIYMSNTGPNDVSKLNGTIYLDKQLYVILDGVSKSNPPKGCAKLAGTAGCDNVSGFRDYLANEWVSNTRIVSEGAGGIAPNIFPAGDYEFYSLYGNTITKVGYGKLIASESSCRWQYHAVFGPVGSLDINPNSANCTAGSNGVSAYEVSGAKQKVATCTCQ